MDLTITKAEIDELRKAIQAAVPYTDEELCVLDGNDSAGGYAFGLNKVLSVTLRTASYFVAGRNYLGCVRILTIPESACAGLT